MVNFLTKLSNMWLATHQAHNDLKFKNTKFITKMGFEKEGSYLISIDAFLKIYLYWIKNHNGCTL